MFNGGLNAYKNPKRTAEQQANWNRFWDNQARMHNLQQGGGLDNAPEKLEQGQTS